MSLIGGYSPLENLSFEVVARHTGATTEYDDIDFLTALPIDTDNETKLSQYYGRAQMKLSALEGRWEHIFSVGITSTDNDNFINQSETNNTGGRKYKFDYQTNFFLDTPEIAQAVHAFTFVFEKEKEKFRQRGIATIFGDPNQDQEMTTNSVVGEYRLRLWERLSLSGSIRRDNNSDFQDATTYRITSAYTHSQRGSNFHISYGTGIKNPTFTERFGFFTSNFFGNSELRPEESQGWEIGIEQLFFNKKGQLGLTYFEEELDDEINGFVFDPALGVFGGFTAQNVTGTSKRKGVEITGQVHLLEDLNLVANYTYINATQADSSGRQVEEIRRPRHLANTNLDYVFLRGKANINMNVNYNGSQKDDWFNTFPATRVKLDSFILVNLAGSYQFNDTLVFYGRVENLLDTKYEEIFGYQGSSRAVFAGMKLTLSF